VGFSSAELSNLFDPISKAWSFAPQITVPIFQTAYNRANLDVAQIQKRIEIAHYERSIQNAFREVSDALAGSSTFDREIHNVQALVADQQKRYELADLRYKNGLDSFLSVLLAQQDIYSAQQRLIQSRFLQLTNIVSLYKALGGGWK
jgi:multidrug efflux system outer membrane protein